MNTNPDQKSQGAQGERFLETWWAMMPYRILVPLDGSSRAERAILVADVLAEALQAEVELLRVIDPTDAESSVGDSPSEELLEALMQRAGDALQITAHRLRRGQPGACQVSRGPAVTTIVEKARTGQFNLIVMTSRRYTGLEEKLLGSVAREVVRVSTVPVLILRERVSLPLEARGLRVLVPLDGSALAEAVFPPLLPLAQALSWSLVLCRISEPESSEPRSTGLAEDLDRLMSSFRAAEVPTTVRIEVGQRGPAIVQLADTTDIDLVAMSTHGRHGLSRLVYGSVTEHVICHASKPVFTVHPPSVPVEEQPGHTEAIARTGRT